MGWLSILPEQFSTVETWLVRLFLLFAFLVFGPWLFIIVYDILLYFWRAATYELPVIGGRARGRQRPRAPSINERPSGHKRRISIPGISRRTSDHDTSTMSTRETRSNSSTIPRTPSKLRAEQHD
ncbi:hypothetical protein CLAFUW4_11699 [Fulvia fulva]|uniref:Uncharacterized protein n=1 Tax=Passalora fulva TaxID=5499 RepID=A0A9Q8URV9_PASFU|nr:uncharacterized protein CLAFUR5_10744 [Fulvia fulva]KAK4619513.1 hypothetical protein CLAFUR4_11704 [Fulvia fulva]KAK4620728.1 hypothetical protein CLAFUR0_11717 [Fulvia fulva]UJO20214.1 hypothetical protein CLAFUR5_10744 [Fulvia fulva]WPV17324.1 hypothetical protein CLAFUW4_11699 [Fulvia fulva]WPV31895.1 hypothetical protein CLAFUW7_11707 [Fulvia fulva]